MIKKIFIKNYKIFEEFNLELNNDLNIIVGDNEAGKSTVLEAINLALTKRLNGRLLEYELTPYLFNGKCVDDYLKSLKTDEPEQPPEIIIELYLEDIPEFAELRGRNNSKKEDSKGIKIEVTFDEDYRKQIHRLLSNIREIVHSAELSDNKKDSVMEKITTLSEEVDKSKTRGEGLLSLYLDVTNAVSEGAKNLDPALERLDKIMRIFGRAKAEAKTAQLSPPEEQKRLPPPEDGEVENAQ